MALGPNPEFAWSQSRGQMFSFCPRQYYYRYYGSWGGWDDRAPEQVRLAYLLSKRDSLASWAGSEVHRGVALYLREGGPMDVLLGQIRERMRDQFRMSRSRIFMEPRQAKHFGLIEHFYEDKLDPTVVRAAWDKVEASLLAFAQSDFRARLDRAQEAGRLVYVEDPDGADFDWMKLVGHGVGDFPIFASPDLVFSPEPGALAIVDWKTGRRPPADKAHVVTTQLALYALWSQEKLSLEAPLSDLDVDAYEFGLPGGDRAGGLLKQEDLDGALGTAAGSVQAMQERLADATENRGEEVGFEPTGSPAKCATCLFRVLCPARQDSGAP